MIDRQTDVRSFPFTAPGFLDPPTSYAQLRAEEPVVRVRLPDGNEGWVATRYEDIRTICTDPRFSRAALTAPGAPRLLPVTRGSISLFSLDPPEHTRLRKLVASAFSSRRVEQMRPRVEDIAGRLVDDMVAAGPPADLFAALARPLPTMVICELLGVPYADVDLFRSWTDVLLSVTPSEADAVAQARARLHAYLAELVEARRARPEDDMISELLLARDEGGALTEQEMLTFLHTLLVAGYHATSGQIVFSVLMLLDRGYRLSWFAVRSEELNSAVDELLRLSTIGDSAGMARIATTDVSLGGVTIKAGEAVIPALASGNRDDAWFDRPDELNLFRSGPPHLSFGIGIHRCLGAQLGRIELQSALGMLARRCGDLALAVPLADLTWDAGSAFRRPVTLPVIW